MDQRARRGLGYLPQEASVFRKLTVEENIAAVLETMAEMNTEQRQRRLEELLKEFHLAHIRKNLGMSLSGGERRRTEIARALASEPRFVLLDEPFAGVDPISVGDIRRIIKHLSKLGIGVLITDHNVRETLGICDRAYIVNDGRIIAEGEPERILDDEHVRAVYLGEDFTM
jgi:lipopolysaccharide export system ATP-binding protein